MASNDNTETTDEWTVARESSQELRSGAEGAAAAHPSPGDGRNK
jgi:hypothetical protein